MRILAVHCGLGSDTWLAVVMRPISVRASPPLHAASLLIYLWIARTFPANGSFTSEQAALYNAVLTVQKHLISLCTESSEMSIMQIHWESCTLLRKELERIGFQFVLGAGTLDTLYPHLVGHPVGIGAPSMCRPLENGS